jgi:hypothetical protein
MNRSITRRDFLETAGKTAMAFGALSSAPGLVRGQEAGARPRAARPAGVSVINPRGRVPVGIIIDDSTCLVNLNRFAMPQFDTAFAGANPAYHKAWQEWPHEIPDAFVRKFGEWAQSRGVKGKYSIVPFPACVGRLDRMLPGWTRAALDDSLELVRTLMAPNWDIHPEMVTHTRVIDTKTGHPFPEHTLKFMENWDWTTGRSVDEIANYLTYALSILNNVGLHCDGITTPGGFGGRALPQLAQATLQSVRSVFHSEIPHYFKHLFDRGEQSVAPRVEYAAGLDTAHPECVVSMIACTGDWTGGWDCSTPEGVDRFISADLKTGRLVDVIERGEPAFILAHWTGVYWNGQELGFKILEEVERRLSARYDHLAWMKLTDVARYWAARELTTIEAGPGGLAFSAPFACPEFTMTVPAREQKNLALRVGEKESRPLTEVANMRQLRGQMWCREKDQFTVCIDLPPGRSRLVLT